MQNRTSTAAFKPQQSQYFDLINDALTFSESEIEKLEQNGFVVSDRLDFSQFKRAYAWIYWKDLPVLVTTDSMLHALHQTYDKMFQEFEMTILTQKLIELLSQTRDHITEQASSNQNKRLTQIYDDLYLYLSVPLLVLKRDASVVDNMSATIKLYCQHIGLVNEEIYHTDIKYNDGAYTKKKNLKLVGIEYVTLFGLTRVIDFTLFQARGHYNENEFLTEYFGAMMWLHLLDFRFIEYIPGESRVHRSQIAAAHILRDAIHAAGQRQNWNEINVILNAFVGWSDNITLNGLDDFILDAGVQSPLHYYNIPENVLLKMLGGKDYGQLQFIDDVSNADLPHNISFMLMGQRFTIESYIMNEVIHPKVEGRAYPSPLDVMSVLGNNHAFQHLSDEFEKYHYVETLQNLREQVSTHSDEFWQSTFYNLWLKVILTLNDAAIDQAPSVMRSTAWKDKMLHTQLASWAQLRHDNILYIKPPYELGLICEYPAGYVEPYPEFYAALGDYARFGKALMAEITPRKGAELYEKLTTYFENLENTATTLEQLAQKELRQEIFTEEDNLFLRSIVVRKYVGDRQYGGWTEEHWDGWYNALLPFNDKTPQLVADVHTNYNEQIGELGVLHIGTGQPVAMTMIVEQDSKPCMYVGPVFTYYELLEPSMPPTRLTDRDWHSRFRIYDQNRIVRLKEELSEATDPEEISELEHELAETEWERTHYPIAPTWASSFRIKDGNYRQLSLPDALDQFRDALDPKLQMVLDQFLIRGYRMSLMEVFDALTGPAKERIADTEALEELTQLIEEKLGFSK